MASFDFICPLNTPLQCNLPASEAEPLESKEKYKAFFMYQFEDQDDYLVETVETSFSGPDYRVFNAAKEAGTGVKLCKICRLALASNFGIACLSPINPNVFQEVGLMLGTEKPVLYLVNPQRLPSRRTEDLPFDLQQEIVIEFSSQGELDDGLKREKGQFLKKVQTYSHFVLEFRKSIKEKIEQLDELKLNIVRCLVLEGRPVTLKYIDYRLQLSGVKTNIHLTKTHLGELTQIGLIERAVNNQEQPATPVYSIPQNFEKVVQDEIFK